MHELFIVILLFIVVLLWLLIRSSLRASQADWGIGWMNFGDGFNRLYCKYYHRFQYTPIELPTSGPAIVVANHSSGLDPMLLATATTRPLRYLIAREYYEMFALRWLFRAMGCIPVDRKKRPEIALRAALSALEAGEVIVIFPQGGITLPGETRKIKSGSLWLAQQAHCSIYPAFISGITGVGRIVSALLKRSHANLVSYPPLDGSEENQKEYLQTLLDGKVPPPENTDSTTD